MTRTVTRRLGARVGVILAAAMLLAGTTGGVLAANTRDVYFGSPTSVGGTGGGFDANGNPVNGILVYSPNPVSTSTTVTHYVAFPVQIQNTGGQTLNHVLVLGGAAAMAPSNPLSPPPAGQSLPPGFSYAAVFGSNTCSVSATSFSCPIGQLGAGSPALLLTIVMSVPTSGSADLPTLPANIGAWVELQLNEGSSTTGTNTDTFYAAGSFAVNATTQDYVQTYILPSGGISTTDDNLNASSSNTTATRVKIVTTPDTQGDNVRIVESGNPFLLDSTCTNDPKVQCFGGSDAVNVIQAANIDIPTPGPDTFTTANPLKLEFRWDVSILPSGVTQQKIKIIHVLDGQTVGTVISNFCKSDPPGPNDTLPCRLNAVKYSDRDLGITVYSNQNGNWKPA